MTLERPDLSNTPGEVKAYIRELEAEIEKLKERPRAIKGPAQEPSEPSEPPTTINVISVSISGTSKRTPRHHYPRQRRAGMGIFDIELDEKDPPKLLTTADEKDSLLVITNQSRAYHLPVSAMPETPVRGRGLSIAELIPYPEGEDLIFIGPLKETGTLALLSDRGYIRTLRHNFVGRSLRPGTQLMDVGRFGPVVAATWTDDSQDEIFIATRNGKAIRFKSRMVHPNGSLGIRLDRDDVPVAVTGTSDDSGVFLLSKDGKGSIRLMSGFRSNKAPGAGGKVALKTEHLVTAISVTDEDDIFIISRLSKIIRFQAVEIPPKEGAVQGVNCMALRADDCLAATVTR